MTSSTEVVLSAILDNHMRHARTPEEIAEVVREAVDVTHPLWPTLLYLWDRPCTTFQDDGEHAFPGHQLRVSTDPESGWGALNFVLADEEAGGAWNTLNPEPAETAPELVFDVDAEHHFERTAALPLDTIREAVTEFTTTGERPTSVLWQPSTRF
ncbi:Imm1 family immunity protein [Allokutzneria oryzae]|uniref:Imm1 family immunity protein n=1 Tax=Allokutzneria oryzae TaxID=1378989 RepID=A0ABV6A6Q0_9PSEU